MTKNLVESDRVRVSPPPPSSKKRIGGNFERNAVPARFMYYHDESWVDFSAEVVEVLRTGFLDRRPVMEALIDGATFIFDFKKMLQIDCATGNHRPISWINENGEFFSPELTKENVMEIEIENENGDKIDVEVKTDRTSWKRKREKEPEDGSSNKTVVLNVIKHQRLEEAGAARWANSRPLGETESAYLAVKDRFLTVVSRVDGGVTVTSIHLCMWERPLGKARLECFQKQIKITEAARGTSNMVFSWYGASAKVVESILDHGFGAFVLPSEVPATDVCGIGVHLSPVELPQLSLKQADADDNGLKHLILCRVILGNVEKVEAGSRQCQPSSVDFDTGSDDPTNPKLYVVWPSNANMHILPECVVSFRPSVNMQGEPRPVVGVENSLEKVYHRLER